MKGTLVIGYGNALRRDDGAGPAVAERLGTRSEVRTIAAHQLLPEHALLIAECDRVIFVDAAEGITRVGRCRTEPARAAMGMGHVGDPTWLLGLVETLSGRSPEAWLVTIPAHDLGHGEGFSMQTAASIEEAVCLVGDLCTKRD